MIMTIKSKTPTKYEIIPSQVQLEAVVKYFKTNANSKGRISFTQREMLEHPIIAPLFGSPSYLNGVLQFLAVEKFLEKIEVGSRGLPSVWDVNKLLLHINQVPTKETEGRTRPKRDAQLEEVEVEVIPTKVEVKSPTPPATQSIPAHNGQILEQIQSTMSDMLGYLQQLPTDMNAHLRHLSGQLELADPNAVTKLHATIEKQQAEKESLEVEKENLQKEIEGLKAELEEANKGTYNKHHIYRQRNLILDEIDRMIASPAWTIRSNATKWRTSIESKLDEIMSEVGIDIESY